MPRYIDTDRCPFLDICELCEDNDMGFPEENLFKRRQMEEKRKLVSIQTIDDVQPIENADSIEVALVGGWNIVIRKGEFKKGDKAFYFEIDSMLPLEDKRFSFLESRGKKIQNGILYHRLKTAKLRGQISQGLLQR